VRRAPRRLAVWRFRRNDRETPERLFRMARGKARRHSDGKNFELFVGAAGIEPATSTV
jgi:hypothetical protein